MKEVSGVVGKGTNEEVELGGKIGSKGSNPVNSLVFDLDLKEWGVPTDNKLTGEVSVVWGDEYDWEPCKERNEDP